MIVRAAGTEELYAVIFRDFFGLDVEVIKDLYMAANKADGSDDHFFATLRRLVFESHLRHRVRAKDRLVCRYDFDRRATSADGSAYRQSSERWSQAAARMVIAPPSEWVSYAP